MPSDPNTVLGTASYAPIGMLGGGLLPDGIYCFLIQDAKPFQSTGIEPRATLDLVPDGAEDQVIFGYVDIPQPASKNGVKRAFNHFLCATGQITEAQAESFGLKDQPVLAGHFIGKKGWAAYFAPDQAKGLKPELQWIVPSKVQESVASGIGKYTRQMGARPGGGQTQAGGGQQQGQGLGGFAGQGQQQAQVQQQQGQGQGQGLGGFAGGQQQQTAVQPGAVGALLGGLGRPS